MTVEEKIKDFSAKYKQFSEKSQDALVSARAAKQRIDESIINIEKYLKELEALPKPVIDGKEYGTIQIDMEQLKNPTYVSSMCAQLKQVINELVDVASSLIDEAELKLAY